jgi:peroxiredoxin (alkyl hydroperoxide reductase subunit C)
MTFGSMAKEFEDLNVQLIGLSVDSIYAHIAWLRKIQDIEWKGMKDLEVKFPLIEDIKMDVAKKYGMIQPNVSTTQAVRAVFFIDPVGKIRAMIYYPQSLGRNFDEIKRVILALQKADADGVATPADWRPGDDVILPAPGSCGTAKDRVESKDADKICYDWFLCFKKDKPSKGRRGASAKKAPAKKAPAKKKV